MSGRSRAAAGRSAPPGAADVGALNAALAVEHAVIYAYDTAGGVLHAAGGGPDDVAAVRSAQDEHRRVRDALIAAVQAAGGGPVEPAAAYRVAVAPTDAASAHRLLADLELAAAQAHDTATGRLRDPGHRTLTATALTGCARRAARFGTAAGLGAADVSRAFPGR